MIVVPLRSYERSEQAKEIMFKNDLQANQLVYIGLGALTNEMKGQRYGCNQLKYWELFFLFDV